MQEAYVDLHALGFAHSAEAWHEGQLVGGLYGVSLGAAFFGESMFARAPDASKLAFVALMQQLRAWDFQLVDCQQETEHLARFGAMARSREEFLQRLERALEQPTRRGPWRFDAPADRAWVTVRRLRGTGGSASPSGTGGRRGESPPPDPPARPCPPSAGRTRAARGGAARR